MKKLLQIFVLIALVAFVSGCSKDNDGGPGGAFTVKIDGTTFKPSIIEAYQEDGFVNIFAGNAQGEGFSISYSVDDIEAGEEYTLGDFGSPINISYFGEGADDFDDIIGAAEGSILVKKSSETAFEATFEFLGDDAAETDFSDGSVNVSIKEGFPQ